MHYVSSTLRSCNAGYSYTENLPSWVQLRLSSLVAMNRSSGELQVPVDSQKQAAYVPCSFLNLILTAQIRFPQFFLCLPRNLSG